MEEIAEEEYSDMNISELYQYCEAQIEYESGYIALAYWDVNSLTLAYVSEELQTELEQFQEKILEEYEIYRAEKEEEEAAAYEEDIKNGVPYVDMPESRIADTSLGAPSATVRHNNEVTGGEVYQANLYDFEKDGVTYFTARCVQGVVTQVWDDRDRLNSSDSNSSENQSGSSGSGGRVLNGSSSSNSKTDSNLDDDNQKEDQYNVYDYDDPEEFYYDNYDDFDGYEDAETYWDDAWR